MMPQNLITLTLYVSFVTYAMFGAYSLTLNKEARLNRVFALLCLCFSIWSFTFAMGTSAETAAEAMVWRRTSVLGWGVAFSLALHFIIVLTESGWSHPQKKPLLILALYLPAVLNVIVFGLNGDIATAQIQLIDTLAGWTTVPVNNAWELFFYLYYLGFSLISLYLLFRWFRNEKSASNKKKAIYLLLSFAAALLLGTLTDTSANHFLKHQLPSLAPVFIMIPVATIYWIIHQYGLMLPKTPKSECSEGIILSRDSRVKIFGYIGMVLAAGSIINFYMRVVLLNDRETGALFSFVLVLMSVVLILIPYLIQSVKHQQGILALWLLLALPVVMLIYFDGPFSNLIWPVPLFVIMITVIFNNRRIFFSVAVMSLLLGIIFWARIPSFDVELGAKAYTLRLIFYAIGISLTALITNIYVHRLVENRKQKDFQQLISEISTGFGTMTRLDFDQQVEHLLEKSGLFMHADRTAVGMFAEDTQTVYYTHHWVDETVKPINGESEKSQLSALVGSRKKLLDNDIVYLASPEILPPEAEEESRLFKKQQIQALVFIPIRSKDRVIGFIEFNQIRKDRPFRTNDFEMLRVLANILADAIATVETEKEMNVLAYYDTLTDLPNRVLFRNRLEQGIDLARRSDKLIGVIFIDLDGFKAVNDAMGHDWGDNVLNQIGRRLSACVRKYDTVARFGGDEFLIMVPQLSGKKDLEEIAKKIMGVFEKSVIIGEQEFYINASTGVAMFPEDGETVNALIRNADMAMYAAKNNGKGQAVFCSGEMKNDVLEKMTLTNSLHQALEGNQLHLLYQPQVCALTQEIMGFEALLRWDHPQLGPVSPSVFIPIAEETGLINSIGEWVLMTACAQNKAWQDAGHKPAQMAVNLSLEQFRSKNLEAIVKKCLDQTGLEPRYLELEITENIAMKESNYVVECLHRLKAMGVAISIDDFGTEFSSLGRLKDLPVDRLKIDIEFIRGIALNPKDESIIAVMIHLAKRLGLKVIAEGVETEIQLGFLKDEACDEIQGHYYYHPLSKDEIECDIYRVSTSDLKKDLWKETIQLSVL